MGFPQTTQPQLVKQKSAGVLKSTIFHQLPIGFASQKIPSIWGLMPGQRYSFTLHSVLNPLEQSFEVESETSDWPPDDPWDDCFYLHENHKNQLKM